MYDSGAHVGSIATPGPQRSHYGGHTACVEVRSGDGTLIMLGNGHERQGHGFDCWQEVQGGGITDAPLAATLIRQPPLRLR